MCKTGGASGAAEGAKAVNVQLVEYEYLKQHIVTSFADTRIMCSDARAEAEATLVVAFTPTTNS